MRNARWLLSTIRVPFLQGPARPQPAGMHFITSSQIKLNVMCRHLSRIFRIFRLRLRHFRDFATDFNFSCSCLIFIIFGGFLHYFHHPPASQPSAKVMRKSGKSQEGCRSNGYCLATQTADPTSTHHKPRTEQHMSFLPDLASWALGGGAGRGAS